MTVKRSLYPILPGLFLFFLFMLPGCQSKKNKRHDTTIVHSPEEMKVTATELIGTAINHAVSHNGITEDSLLLGEPQLAKFIYENNSYVPLWFNKQDWFRAADSLFEFIRSSRLYGLFPEDYHLAELTGIRERIAADTLAKKDRNDALLWSKADMMLTDAFVGIIKDIKLGRLPNDSITLRKDSVLMPEFYQQQFESLKKAGSLVKLVELLEPKERGYHLIKEGIQKFLDSADYRVFTLVPSPKKEPGQFKRLLQKRLFEGGYIGSDSVQADSAHIAEAVKKFQHEKDIAVDGVAGEGTLRLLNMSDREKFIRIAISLDKYKQLPEKMPYRYIWVNVPGYYMDVVEGDSVKFSSRVICGKPKTKTPLLNSAISILITYPQWVPPPSIVRKEILPAVKKNPGYLARKGFSLVNSKGEEVDPYSVDWSKYNNSIPYRVVQGSGDANALGIMKFHFDNKYSVYLHDTNQRYLFASSRRSLSHGCVRVQEWEKLAYYILRYDSLTSGGGSKIDSVKTWLQKKQKRNIAVKNKLPVYIRYITCQGKNGGIVFYDDPYGDDQLLREKYFAAK